MWHICFGSIDKAIICVYLAPFVLCLYLLFKYAYKCKSKFSEKLHKFFAWGVLIAIIIAIPITIVSAIIFILYISAKY